MLLKHQNICLNTPLKGHDVRPYFENHVPSDGEVTSRGVLRPLMMHLHYQLLNHSLQPR